MDGSTPPNPETATKKKPPAYGHTTLNKPDLV